MPKDPVPPVEILIEQLHGPDWTARCDAARLLGQSRDPRAVDALLPDLTDRDWRVRRNAAQALGALRDKRAVEPLLLALKDRVMTVRQRAIVALGRIKDSRALPALLEVVCQDKHESYDAVKAVRKFGKKAVPEIAKAFEECRSQQLLLMLVELKYDKVLDLLLPLLESPEPATRLTAIRELGNLGDQAAIPYLLEELKTNDLLLKCETIRALGKLRAMEAVPSLLALLTDDELYGPRSNIYHAVTEAFQSLGNITQEIANAFPGNYPAIFNMGGASISLPESMGLLNHLQDPGLLDTLTRFQNGFTPPPGTDDQVTGAMRKTLDDMAWKFGVMFADARDARQERVKRLEELLTSSVALTRAAAALSLPWYGQEPSLKPLSLLSRDPDERVQTAANWAGNALRKVVSYRNQFGM